MNTHWISSRGAFFLTLGLFLWTATGFKHGPPKSKMPVPETQAPVVKSVSRPAVDPREKQFQEQIDSMQEQISALTARTDAMARFHGVRMGPKWVEKVQAAREEASRPSERMRYLEATKALLARKLQALRAEMKVYEEFELSDPAIPRR
jgi:hypothetical protein